MNFKILVTLFFCILLLFSCEESVVLLKNETLQERLKSEKMVDVIYEEQEDFESLKNEKQAGEKSFGESDGGEDKKEGLFESYDTSHLEEAFDTTKETLAEEENEVQRKVRDCLSVEVICPSNNPCVRKSDFVYEVIGSGRPRMRLVLHLKKEPFCTFQKHLWELGAPVGSVAKLSTNSGLDVSYVIDVFGLYRLEVASFHQSGVFVKREILFAFTR